MALSIGVISPQDWGLLVAESAPTAHPELGLSLADLDSRARKATYDWLLHQFDESAGAFFGFFRAPDGYQEPCQTVNLIAPWQLLAAFDRYHDRELLLTAERAANWFYERHVITHPMSVVAGGVRDGVATDHLWTKFTAEEVITCRGLFDRTRNDVWRMRAIQSGGYLLQARRHDFAPRYELSSGQWLALGWDSWGRAIEANLLLWKLAGEEKWLAEALRWGEHALAIQAPDGGFYLIDGEYYNTDLAADELRGLTLLYEVTSRQAYLDAACRFADWHLERQTASGAWPLTIDRDGNVVIATIGPGDVPNIGIALLRLHSVTADARYRDTALRTLHYTLQIQATPESRHPYLDDDKVRWGFWSWDPYYDYTLSGDQSTHHTRGIWFMMDYFSTDESA